MSKTGIVVLGMHRSGTSALSGELSRLGAFMGKSLLPPKEGVNDKGYWENVKFLNFNERLLEQCSSRWDDPFLLEIQDVEALRSSALQDKAITLLHTEYEGQRLWGLKDPRTSVLMPFWQTAFAAADMNPFYVIMMRRPLEVARSLEKRDGYSINKGLALWFTYSYLSLKNTVADNRLVVQFDDLIANPNVITEKISEKISVDLTGAGDSFVERGLKNQSQPQEDPASELEILCENFYDLVISNDHKKALELSSRFLEIRNSNTAAIREHLRMVQDSEINFRNKFEDEYFSFTWKASLPLRRIEGLLRTKNSELLQ